MLRAVLVVVVIGCGGGTGAGPNGARRPLAPSAEPTLGICASERTPGATGAAALVQASREALLRGCPREAMFDAIAAREAGGGAAADLAVLEAGQDALSTRLVGMGQSTVLGSDLPDEAWVKAFDPMSFDAIEKVLAAMRSGALPAAARDSGRLATALVRFTPTPCLLENAKVPPAEMKKGGIEFRKAVFGEYAAEVLGNDATAMSRMLGASHQWACDFAPAASSFEDVARAEAKAGRASQALEARLTAWEMSHLVEGVAGMRSDAFALVTGRARAARSEAAAQGVGPVFRAGTEALAALDKLAADRAAGEPTHAARIAFLRAVVTLEQLAKPADAERLATRAIELATKARRADLLDGARLVAALAALRRGGDGDATTLLTDLFASLKQRGALGARLFVGISIAAIGRTLADAGRHLEQLSLTRAAYDATRATRPSLLALSSFGNQVANALSHLGRIEEAIEQREALEVEMRANPDRVANRDLMLRQIIEARSFDEVQIGRLDRATELLAKDTAGSPDHASAVALAALRGDLEAIRRFVRGARDPDNILPAIGVVCAAKPKLIVDAAKLWIKEKRRFAERRDADVLKEQTRFDQELTAYGSALIKCAIDLRDPEMARLGREMLPDRRSDDFADAADAIIAGKPDVAVGMWTRSATEALSRVDARGGLALSQNIGEQLQLAAIAHLDLGPSHVERALELAQQSRARDLRAARVARPDAKADPAVARLTKVEGDLQATAKRITTLDDLAASADAQTRPGIVGAREAAVRDVARLEKERDAATRSLATANPAAYRAAALAPPATLRELQGTLAADEVLVVYLTRSNSAWAIVVGRSSLNAVRLQPLDADRLPRLFVHTQAYRLAMRKASEGRGLVRVKSAAAPATPDLPTLRAELYDILVRPLEPSIPAGARVIVVPDAMTADLAFAELGPAGAPWIARNPLRLVPGTYLLGAAGKRPARERALVVGDPDFGEPAPAAETYWPRLPGTRTEAVEIARTLGATPILGGDATEARIVREMAGATTIHLATHGLADPLRPTRSVVVLSLRAPGTGDDGYLHAYEIERLRLSANLVVLSACETGQGQARGNEGLLALDRAFLVAGAATVVSSLWVVPDDATAALMTRFYAELRTRPVDVALAAAMNHVRAQPKWADPRNWAAFRVVGAGLR